MNERIKELEQQCWEARQYGPPWFDCNKFARLLLQVCIDQCEDIADNANSVANGIFVTEHGKLAHQGMWAGAKSCAGAIANQFGIEDEVAV